MTITAKIIADSISDQGIRLTTMQLRYPKWIHGELMTHRVFSRNASSSRAIPVERLIQDVIDDPAMPVFWGKNQAGMQAVEECDARLLVRVPGMPGYAADGRTREEVWLSARDEAIEKARSFAAAGYHKQIVNRIIEPWCHINVVVTATEWANFFALRCHPAAQPEMRVLAEAMRDAMEKSEPRKLKSGQWHLPYVDENEDSVRLQANRYGFFTTNFTADNPMMVGLIRLSVARCARVSYLTQEGKPPNIEDDLRLYDRLVGSVPLHASPAEHQATPDTTQSPLIQDDKWSHPTCPAAVIYRTKMNWWSNPHQHGNLVGWRQYRKMLPNENVLDR